MRIGLFGDGLVPPRKGIGNYALRLFNALAESFPRNDYTVAVPETIDDLSDRIHQELVPERKFHNRRLRRLDWQIRGAPRALSEARFDLVFSPGNPKTVVGQGHGRTPQAFNLHDVSPLAIGHTHRLARRVEFRLWVSRALQSAGALSTDSQFSASEIRRCFPKSAPPAIQAIPLGVAAPFTLHGPAEHFEEPTFVCLGSLEPRKNWITALRAFEEYRRKGQRGSLLLIGPEGWKHGAFDQALVASPFRKDVQRLGFLSNSRVAEILRGATAMVFPSLYEGFGLPVLEAMACGTPVIASGGSSIPEVLGEAGLMIADPMDSEQFARLMGRLAVDESLRKEMTAKGVRRASAMTWEQTAHLTQAWWEQSLKR